MNNRAPFQAGDWPKAVVSLALLILSLLLVPHGSVATKVVFGVLLVVAAFWAAAAALRDRRRKASTTGEVVRYYLWLSAAALVIALGWFLVFCIAADFFA